LEKFKLDIKDLQQNGKKSCFRINSFYVSVYDSKGKEFLSRIHETLHEDRIYTAS